MSRRLAVRKEIYMKVSEFAKAVVAGVAAAALVAERVVSDGTVTPQEAVEIVLAVLAVYGVYKVPNAAPARDAE